jgi:hypothetical protein
MYAVTTPCRIERAKEREKGGGGMGGGERERERDQAGRTFRKRERTRERELFLSNLSLLSSFLYPSLCLLPSLSAFPSHHHPHRTVKAYRGLAAEAGFGTELVNVADHQRRVLLRARERE